MLRLLSCVWLVLCSISLPAQAASGEYSLHWRSLTEGPSRSLEEIRQAPESHWQAFSTGIFNAGFSDKPAWLRTEFKVPAAGDLVLELSNPQIAYADLYVQRGAAPVETQIGGLAPNRPRLKLEPYHNQIFSINQARAGETLTLWLRVQAVRPLIVWPRLYSDLGFYRQVWQQRLWLGIYGGIFFALSLLSLMIWVSTHDRGYANFLLFIATGGLLQGHLLGMLHEYYPPGNFALSQLIGVILPIIGSLAYAHFARHFLGLKQSSPQSDRLMRLLMWLHTLILPLYFLLGASFAIPAIYLVGAFTGALGLIVGILAFVRGNRAARFYLLANGLLFTGGCLHVANGFGLLPVVPLTLYAFPLGTGLCALVVGFALADKVYLLQRAQIQAQNDHLIAEQQIIEVLRESEGQLENRVQERTLQLEAALALQSQQSTELENNHRNMTALHEERGAFLQIAAHDLQNPTAAIISYVDLLRERWHAWDDEKKLHRLGNVRSMAQLTFDIIRNLLDVNAIESGHYALRPTALDASKQLQNVCDSYQARCAQKGIELLPSLPEHPVWVLADKTALHQIIDNLISNAVKYSPQGRRIYVHLDTQTPFAHIQIRDEGPGLSEDDQTRLFRKFTRLSARPTGGEHSTGLGLSIVKLIVEASGGQVGCSSRLGEGACFFFNLPLADQAEQPTP